MVVSYTVFGHPSSSSHSSPLSFTNMFSNIRFPSGHGVKLTKLPTTSLVLNDSKMFFLVPVPGAKCGSARVTNQ